MTRPKTLSCGGKGPCCHIGYDHRHCEHCDVVIDTRPANWWYTPYIQPTIRPYQPYWGTFGNSADNAQASGTLYMQGLAGTGAVSAYNAKAPPDPTVAHVCEVNP